MCTQMLCLGQKGEFLPVFGRALGLLGPDQYGVHPWWLGTVVVVASRVCADEAFNITRW